MEREQIIKALKCCINHEGDNCHICPYHYTLNGFNHNCKEDMCEDALALIKELIDSEDYWKRQTFDACMDKGRMDDKIKELVDENERLRFISAHICVGDVITSEQIEKQRMAHTLPGMHGDPVGERGCCGIHHECIANTVQKIQERFKERLDISVCGYSTEEVVGDVLETLDRVAKEMLEESK